MIDERLVRLVWLFCFCAVSATGVHGGKQTGNGAQVSVTRTSNYPALSDRAKKQLKEKLGSAVPTSLHTVNADDAPLEIKEAIVWFVKMEGNYGPADTSVHTVSEYAVKMRLRFSNRGERRVTGMGLEFKDPEARNGFFVYRNRLDVPGGKSLTFEIPFMVMNGDPSRFSIAVNGVGFDYAMAWGSFPAPLFRMPAARPSAPAPELPVITAPELPVITPPVSPPATMPGSRPPTAVDKKPRPLNSPQPRYTEQARNNGVCGTVSLRILIGAEGKVIQVRALTWLPDWLTDEAIQAAYDLKFEPARKGGQAVAYWMPVVVEFNLK